MINMMNYSLTVRNVANINDFQVLSERLEEFDLTRYVFDTGAYFKKQKEAIFKTWEEQEWQNYNDCMIMLSEKLPEMTFELTVQMGEQFWKIYYKDGIAETCFGTVIFETPKKIAWDSLLVF